MPAVVWASGFVAGLAAGFTGAVVAVVAFLAVVPADDVSVDFAAFFLAGWAVLCLADAGAVDFLATAGVVLAAAFVAALLAVSATGLSSALLEFSPCSCCLAAASNKPNTSSEALTTASGAASCSLIALISFLIRDATKRISSGLCLLNRCGIASTAL